MKHIISLLFIFLLTNSAISETQKVPSIPQEVNDTEQGEIFHDKYEEPEPRAFDTEKYRNPEKSFFSSPSMLFYGGQIESEQQSNMNNETTDFVLGMSTQQDLVTDNISFEVTLIYIQRSYDTTIPDPLFGSYSNRMELTTFAISSGIRAFWPEASNLRAFASAGISANLNKLSVYGSTFIFLGYTEEEESESIDPYATVGIEYYSSEYVFQLQYRQMPFTSSFTNFNVPETELGGKTILIGFGFIW